MNKLLNWLYKQPEGFQVTVIISFCILVVLPLAILFNGLALKVIEK